MVYNHNSLYPHYKAFYLKQQMRNSSTSSPPNALEFHQSIRHPNLLLVHWHLILWLRLDEFLLGAILLAFRFVALWFAPTHQSWLFFRLRNSQWLLVRGLGECKMEFLSF